MFQAAKEIFRLSWKPNLIANAPAAVVVTLLCAWTMTAGLRLSGHLTLGLLHFILACFLLELLWLPLTWFRHRFCAHGPK
jgi:hypothetical protein